MFGKKKHYEKYWSSLDIDSIIEFFYGKNDEKVNAQSRELFARILCEEAKKYAAPPRVLEAGCGPGVELTSLRRFQCPIEYTGMDFTEQMILAAQKKNPDGTFKFENIEQISFGDNSFDIVFCRAVFEHLSYYEKALSELFRCAKDKVYIIWFHNCCSGPDQIVLRKKTKLAGVDTTKRDLGTYSNTYNRDKVVAYLRKLGMKWLRIYWDEENGEIWEIKK